MFFNELYFMKFQTISFPLSVIYTFTLSPRVIFWTLAVKMNSVLLESIFSSHGSVRLSTTKGEKFNMPCFYNFQDFSRQYRDY